MQVLHDELASALKDLESLREQDRTQTGARKDLLSRLAAILLRLDSEHRTVQECLDRATAAADEAARSQVIAAQKFKELEDALRALTLAAPQAEDVFRPALSTVKVRALPKPKDPKD